MKEKTIRIIKALKKKRTKLELAELIYGKLEIRKDKQSKMSNLNRDLEDMKDLIEIKKKGINVYVKLNKEVNNVLKKEIETLIKLLPKNETQSLNTLLTTN